MSAEQEKVATSNLAIPSLLVTSGVLPPVCGCWPPGDSARSISIEHKRKLDVEHVRAVVTAGIKVSEVAVLLTRKLAEMFSNRARYKRGPLTRFSAFDCLARKLEGYSWDGRNVFCLRLICRGVLCESAIIKAS